MKLYLAHPFEDRHYVHRELEPLINDLGVRTVNPFVDREDSQLFFQRGKSDRVIMMEELRRWSPEEIVETELSMIGDADGLFAYLPRSSTGTCMEIFYNSHYLGRGRERTFVWNPSRNLDLHPWLNYLSTMDHRLEKLIERVDDEVGK